MSKLFMKTLIMNNFCGIDYNVFKPRIRLPLLSSCVVCYHFDF